MRQCLPQTAVDGGASSRSQSNFTVIPYNQAGVLCVGILMTDRGAVRTAVKAAAEHAKNEHYRRLLPSAAEQIALMEQRRIGKMQFSVAPHDPRNIREWAAIQLEIYQLFSPYLENEVNRFAKHKSLRFDYAHNRSELWSHALQVFSHTLDDYRPGVGEISRLLSQRLKYELLHLSQRLASQRGSAAGSVHMPDKAFREAVSFRAAKDAGKLSDLIARRKWTERKVQALEGGQHLLDPICRLDGPVDSRDSTIDNLHESIGDSKATPQAELVSSREVCDTLNKVLVESLPPLHRLVISANFGLRAISMKEAAHKVKHAGTGRPINCAHLDQAPSYDELPELLGLSSETIRRIRVEGLQRLQTALHRHGIDASALRDLSHADEQITV